MAVESGLTLQGTCLNNMYAAADFLPLQGARPDQESLELQIVPFTASLQ